MRDLEQSVLAAYANVAHLAPEEMVMDAVEDLVGLGVDAQPLVGFVLAHVTMGQLRAWLAELRLAVEQEDKQGG